MFHIIASTIRFFLTDTAAPDIYTIAYTLSLHDDLPITSADDLACVEEIAQGCETRPITGLAGKTRFPELAALIDHAVLFIGVDSAPGHIAAAVKTPVICLFGATDHVFWRPWTDNIIQFWAGDYAPMPKRSELDRDKKYMSVIPAEDVIAATENMLPQNAQIIEMDAPV